MHTIAIRISISLLPYMGPWLNYNHSSLSVQLNLTPQSPLPTEDLIETAIFNIPHTIRPDNPPTENPTTEKWTNLKAIQPIKRSMYVELKYSLTFDFKWSVIVDLRMWSTTTMQVRQYSFSHLGNGIARCFAVTQPCLAETGGFRLVGLQAGLVAVRLTTRSITKFINVQLKRNNRYWQGPGQSGTDSSH